MPTIMSSNLTEELEKLVDRHGLKQVLLELGTICRLKAEHLRENWQDPVLAKRWSDLAPKIEQACRRL